MNYIQNHIYIFCCGSSGPKTRIKAKRNIHPLIGGVFVFAFDKNPIKYMNFVFFIAYSHDDNKTDKIITTIFGELCSVLSMPSMNDIGMKKDYSTSSFYDLSFMWMVMMPKNALE